MKALRSSIRVGLGMALVALSGCMEPPREEPPREEPPVQEPPREETPQTRC